MSRQGRVVPIYVGTLGPKFIEYLRQCGWQEDAPFSLFLERELHHGGKGPERALNPKPYQQGTQRTGQVSVAHGRFDRDGLGFRGLGV